MSMMLRPIAGAGVLARHADLVLLCDADDVLTPALLDAVAEVAAAGGDGRRLGRRLAALLSAAGLDDTDDAPALCAFGPTGGGLAVLVHGDAVVEAIAAGQPVRLDGSTAVTWVDRVLGGPVESLRAALAGTAIDAPVDQWSRLDAGVVRAGGLDFAEQPASAPAGTTAPAAATAPVEPTAPAAGSVPAASSVPVASSVPAEATEPADEPVEVRADDGDSTMAASLADMEWTDEFVADFGDEPSTNPPGPAPAEAFEPKPAADVDAPTPGRDVPRPGSDAREPAPRPDVYAPTPGPEVPTPGAEVPTPGAEPYEPRPGSDARDPTPRPDVYEPTPGPDVPTPGSDAREPTPRPDAYEPTRSPEAYEPRPAASEAPAHPGPLVLGVDCANGHFNDPRAQYCAACGVPLAQPAPNTYPGRRPALGVLVLDDGTSLRLDAGYVVGREPERDPDVVSGRSRPLRIADREGVVSRIHARIDLDGWDVQVVDLGSSNGTHLCEQGDDAWTRIPARTPVPIRPGTRVLFGRRGFRYESHRGA